MDEETTGEGKHLTDTVSLQHFFHTFFSKTGLKVLGKFNCFQIVENFDMAVILYDNVTSEN